MRYLFIHQFFNPERLQENNDTTALRSYPALKKLKLTPEQQRARAKAIAKLDEYINDATKFSRGHQDAGLMTLLKDLSTLDFTEKGIQKQMKDIKNLLLTKPYQKSDWDTVIETHLNRINADGTANLETFDTKMSKRVFLQRIIGPSEAGKILVENSPEIQARVEVLHADKERLKKKSRLEQFLILLDNEKDGLLTGTWRALRGKAGIDSEIQHIRSLLAKGDVDGAVSKASEVFDGRWKGMTISNVVGSDNGLADAQRALGHTSAAEVTLLNMVSDNSSEENTNKRNTTNDKQKAFYNRITKEIVQNEADKYKTEATEIYEEAINVLPYNDPDRIEMTDQKEAYIHNYAIFLALKNLVTEYIRTYGSADLPTEMKKLDDMRGLYGITNFSDENARLFKEIVIVIASIAVTFGASAMVNVVAIGARAVAARTVVQAGAVATKFPGAARVGNAVRNIPGAARVGNAVRNIPGAARVGNALNTTRGVVAQAGNIASKIPGAQALKSSLIFTSVDAALRETGLGSDGQRIGFAPFVDNFLKNTVMFGAFSGMEKFLTSGFLKHIPGLKKLSINPAEQISFVGATGNILKLSAGDLVVLQALHAAETGKLETDWKALAAIAVFRGGQALFPNLIDKFKKLPKAEQEKLLADVVFTEKNVLRNFSAHKSTQLTSDLMQSRAELNAQLANPKRGDIVKLFDGSEWRYTGNGSRWQQLDIKKGWAGMNYTDGVQLTTSGLKKKYYTEMKLKAQNSSNLISSAQTSRGSQVSLVSPKTNEGLINARERIAKGPEKIDVRSYAGKDIKESLMKGLSPQNGDHIRLHIGEGKNMQNVTYRVEINRGDVKYVKVSGDEGFPNSFSNKRGDTLFVSKNDVYLDSNKMHKVTELEIYTPREVRLQHIDDLIKQGNAMIPPAKPTKVYTYLDDLNGKFTKPKKGDIVKLSDGSEWRYSTSMNGYWQKLEPGKKWKEMGPLDGENLSNSALIRRLQVGGVPYTQQYYLTKLAQVAPKVAEDIIPAISSAKSGNPSKFKNFFQDHWKAIAIGMAEWTLLKNLLDREKTNPFFMLPDVPPQDAQSAFELCMLCFSENEESKIDYSRKSVSGKELNADYRMEISRRWMQTQEWVDLMNKWDDTMMVLEQFEVEGVKLLQEKMIKIETNPTVEVVRDLQRCINMVANDNSAGQDGILGPNTTKAIHEFISQCYSQYINHANYSEGLEYVFEGQNAENQNADTLGESSENQDMESLNEDQNTDVMGEIPESTLDVMDLISQESSGQQTPVPLVNPVSSIDVVPPSQE